MPDPAPPKNPIEIIINVPPGTEVRPRLRQLLDDLAKEIEDDPGAVKPEERCNGMSRCGTACGSN
jgi:hypothetical protein